ncbi:hypothetical protein MLD38_008491 [Melastoma candidum]|uniref:Uncharacterized protein n=1 Tax=Melastoma candidum TaxID=119954 RepID=A0ACB9RVU8_9MYRT|nr:hypothetical protein MLD38_008491 [Melastoma candidum]
MQRLRLRTCGFACCDPIPQLSVKKALILTNRKWTSSVRDQEKYRLTPKPYQHPMSASIIPRRKNPRRYH